MVIHEMYQQLIQNKPDNMRYIELGMHPATESVFVLKITYNDKTVVSAVQRKPNKDVELCIQNIRANNVGERQTGSYDWGTVIIKFPIVTDNEKVATKCLKILDIYQKKSDQFYRKSQPTVVKC